MNIFEKIKNIFTFNKDNFLNIENNFSLESDFNFTGEDGDDDPGNPPAPPPPCPPKDPDAPPCPPCNGGGGGGGPSGRVSGKAGHGVFKRPGIALSSLASEEFEEFSGFENKIVGIGPIPGGPGPNICPTPPQCPPGGTVTVQSENCTASFTGGPNGGGVQCTFTY